MPKAHKYISSTLHLKLPLHSIVIHPSKTFQLIYKTVFIYIEIFKLSSQIIYLKFILIYLVQANPTIRNYDQEVLTSQITSAKPTVPKGRGT